VLSMMVQGRPRKDHEPRPLRLLDFNFESPASDRPTPDQKAE